MTSAWGHPGLRPATGEWSKGYSPLFKYEWAPTYEALQRYAGATEGSAFDGIITTLDENGTLGALTEKWLAPVFGGDPNDIPFITP